MAAIRFLVPVRDDPHNGVLGPQHSSVSARLNVRCCCQPQKILGTLPAPANDAPVKLFLQHQDQIGLSRRYVSLPIAVFAEVPCLTDEALDDLSPEVLRSMVYRERAYKAEGMTIEQLKQIPGFVPNDEASS